MEDQWFYETAGDPAGPYTSREIRQLARTGAIDRETRIRKNASNWVPAERVSGLFPPPRDGHFDARTNETARDSVGPNRQDPRADRYVGSPRRNVRQIGTVAGVAALILIVAVAGILHFRTDPVAEQVSRGKRAFEAGDNDLAVACLSEALRIDSANAEAFAFRGAAYTQKGSFDRALADSSEAIRLDPKNERWYRFRALVYRDQKAFDQGLADCARALHAKAHII